MSVCALYVLECWCSKRQGDIFIDKMFICYRFSLYYIYIYRYNMIHVSYICLPPQKSSRFLVRKTTNLEAFKNLRCLAGLPILKDWMMIMDLGTWPPQIAAFWWMLGTPEFCWF